MSLWDVFHSDRLELARGLSAEEIRAGLAAGSIRDDDLARPSGTSDPWARVVEITELLAPAAPPPPPGAGADDLSFPVLPEPSPPAPIAWDWETEDETEDEDDFEDAQDEEEFEDDSEEPPTPSVSSDLLPDWELGEDDLELDRPETGSRVNLPAARSRDYDEPVFVDEEEDEEDGGVVSLRRAGPQRVEELDLAAMVDVAFQLVLFFLVTATTVLYKSLEIPKPSGEAPPEAVAQGRNRTLDDLREDYILVEIDPEGRIQVDREPVAADFGELAERLRSAREVTNRTTMLLSADFSTPHRNAVMAYDVANEIGLGIAIARPVAPAGPPPALRPAAAPKGEGA
ncbi:biopolymer transporter ExbD [Paludisphaera sp.]|uniref:ExbD/TolR family protein n=1 Tax=Paludisphaera sp. TaxID=2017432 RepID=UPI00301B90FB